MAQQRPTPVYQRETAQFRQELDDPQFIRDDQGRVTYAVRRFNRDHASQRPVVLNLPFGLNGTDRLGIATLSAYARHIERPIITMDAMGIGGTSKPGWRWGWGAFASVKRAAASETRVLREMGVEQASFVGVCLGSRLAHEKAKAFGEGADRLVTISGLGYSALSFGQACRRLVDQDERSKARAVSRNAIRNLNLGDVWDHKARGEPLKWRVAVTFGVLASTAAMSVADLNELSPTTRTTAITVPNDVLADADAHRRAVEARNEQYPGTAQLIILNTNAGHAYTTYNAPAMAQLTNALLAS